MPYLSGEEAASPVGLFQRVHNLYYAFFKRVIDIVGSLSAILLFSPLFLVLFVLIRLTSKGPAFFTQERVGRNGRPFKIYKFRTMYLDAEKILQANPELLAAYKNNSYKLQDDPRVTPVGKVLRRLSLDELPQLLNILIGNMSLVGPRAFQKDELAHQQEVYPHTVPWVKVALTGKPGASGPWQVSGRSDINFDKRVEMDAQYVLKRSLLYDLWIILKTPIVMITGKGAV